MTESVVERLDYARFQMQADESEYDDRTVIGESELVRRYDEINAKTMYNMMEEIGDQRLFFLTNQQAELLAESEASIDRLIKALELPKEPKLLTTDDQVKALKEEEEIEEVTTHFILQTCALKILFSTKEEMSLGYMH